MKPQKIGILHPGAMGISVAASAQNSGHTVYWVSSGRSAQTHERARKWGLSEVHSLAELCETCAVIVSVCPPGAAEAVADEVRSHAFTGLYLDANAISPERAVRIGQTMLQAGATFVDGGIIGGPAWKPNSTWLYLSGEAAPQAAACFAAGPLETCIVGEAVGKASALKMCFAAYTKGTTALLCAILAAAEALDVRTELAQQWSRNGSDFATQATDQARQVTAKAWRFVGEMDEIAATFREAGLPGEFHLAAADIYRRLADFKGAPDLPALEDVLAALLQSENHTGVT
jgi:3-hydroxyisobutyrate dehydrogenase-like beta-hydroxyacid dehydrogenase